MNPVRNFLGKGSSSGVFKMKHSSKISNGVRNKFLNGANGVKTLKDFDLNKKRVLVRSDFNVPLDKEGNILDDFRIKQTLPTIKYLIKKGAKVILMSHLGKPEGKFVKELKMDRVQEKLMEYLDLSITKAKDCVGKEIEDWTKKMASGEILVLENLRFHIEEEKGDLKFAKELSKLGDIFINEAFSACHRPHASIVGVPKYLPSGIGLLLEKEIENLKKIIKNPSFPLIAIFGGREGNFKVINKISRLAKSILIGYLIKKQIDKEKIVLKYPKKIFFPLDSIGKENLDIGPKTIEVFKKEIFQAKTIFWSGPLGKIEDSRYQKGTKEIAKAIIKSNAFSALGGGETIEFINKLGLSEKFSHLSTGGNAMFALLAGEKLPGIEVLK